MNLRNKGNTMLLVGVVVAVLVAAGIAIYFVANKNSSPDKTSQQVKKPAVRDSSNKSIDKDIASFDAQVKAYETDSSAVDESMNDKPDNLQ
jgi:cytoskeletal protein RodZ